jgi:KDO2-lipid IV(A) lauroyltransferase
LRALHNGGIVALMADRNLTGQGIEVDFFGRPAVVSRGPAWLIAHSRAPVLIGAGLRQTDESFRASVARLDVQRTGDLRADELANAQIVMSAVESEIRACPDQWMMFAPVWAGEAEPDSYSA